MQILKVSAYITRLFVPLDIHYNNGLSTKMQNQNET